MIEQIKQALEEATKGQWNVGDMDTGYSNEVFVTDYKGFDYFAIAEGLTIEDAHLIANAPEWLRYLIGEVERLKQDRDSHQRVCMKEMEKVNELQKALEESQKQQDRLLNIAKGCADYGGGYRHDAELFGAFQHGIQTVNNALDAATKKDDGQLRVLESVGKQALKKGE